MSSPGPSDAPADVAERVLRRAEVAQVGPIHSPPPALAHVTQRLTAM